MFSIALRFAEKFSPNEGTIKAHQRMIDNIGHVWYGKMGTAVSDANIKRVLSEDNPRILLIHSGGVERYWAYISDIKKEIPELKEIPDYYRNLADSFKTWFCIKKIEPAEKTVMSKCIVFSSRAILSNASKYSMSPYFLIEYNEK